MKLVNLNISWKGWDLPTPRATDWTAAVRLAYTSISSPPDDFTYWSEFGIWNQKGQCWYCMKYPQIQVIVKKITSSRIFSIACKICYGWFPSQAFLNTQAQLFLPLFFFLVLKYPPLPGEVITFEWYRWRPSFLNWQMKSASTCNIMYNYNLINV